MPDGPEGMDADELRRRAEAGATNLMALPAELFVREA